eukprot:scaffold83971_cov84-Attheya_sp.AAC.3
MEAPEQTCMGFWQSIGVAATAVLLRCSITAVTVYVTGGDGWVWGLLTFPSLKLQLLRGVGVGLAGKGGMVGSGTKLSFGAIQSQWWCVVQQVGEMRRITGLGYSEAVREVVLVVI